MRRLAALFASIVALAGCRDTRPNVILVTLDTTRADHLGFAGRADARTPRLDALAARSFVFRDAIAAAPLTLPAHATILSGTYPRHHGVYYNDGFRLAEDVVTLPKILAAQGYDTAAFVSAFPLDSQFRLDQGFDVYDDDFERADAASHIGFAERRASETNAAVARFLDLRHSRKPLFLWVHYFDPHAPYEPPPPWDSIFAGSPYDGEIAAMDEQFGVLEDDLAKRGLLQGAIVAVVGDHGESLGEHDEASHSAYIYDSTMRVPFLLSLPGRKGTAIGTQVATVDLLPTVLGALALPIPPAVQGRDLHPLLDGRDAAASDVYLESRYCQILGWAPLRALRNGRYKLILAPERELYDLAADPHELENVAARQPAIAAELEERLSKLEQRLRGPSLARSAARPMDEEALRRLASLGYIAAAMPAERFALPSAKELAKLGNPRDKADILAARNAVLVAMESGRVDLAAVAARRMLELDPHNPKLMSLAGTVLAGAGASAEALRLLEAASRDDAADSGAHLALGRLLRARNEPARAARELEIAARLEPRAELYVELGETQRAQGNRKEAREALQKALALDSSSTSATLLAALLAQEDRQLDEADRTFSRVLERLPSLQAALAGRVEVARLHNDAAAEEAAIVALLRAVPDAADARLRLAELWAGRDALHAAEQLKLIEATASLPALREEAARRRQALGPPPDQKP